MIGVAPNQFQPCLQTPEMNIHATLEILREFADASIDFWIPTNNHKPIFLVALSKVQPRHNKYEDKHVQYLTLEIHQSVAYAFVNFWISRSTRKPCILVAPSQFQPCRRDTCISHDSHLIFSKNLCMRLLSSGFQKETTNDICCNCQQTPALPLKA